MNVLGLGAHFTNRLGIRLNPVIGVREIAGAHSGYSLARIVREIVEP